MDFFSERNVIQKCWAAKNISVPPNSAPGLRHCLATTTISLAQPEALGKTRGQTLRHHNDTVEVSEI